jgi:hypothetical protein
MSLAKPAVVGALAAVAAALAGCGAVAVKPAGAGAPGTASSRGRVAGPVDDRLACLRANHLSVPRVGSSDLLIAGGARVHFAPTPGAALAEQIEGRAQGAEVIGSALLYPGKAPDDELRRIEDCLGAGVRG